MDLVRNEFFAVHVNDSIMVGSSSQLSGVVGQMKQNLTMKVTHPLSSSSPQTCVARCLRHGDAIWELPIAKQVTGMLNEHGMQNAKIVVTFAVNRNDDDDDSEEARSVLGISTSRHAFAANNLAKFAACSSKSDIITRFLRYQL